MPSDRWLSSAELRARLGVSRMTIHRWTREGYLPQPLRPTGAGRGRVARWLASEIEAFEAKLVEERAGA